MAQGSKLNVILKYRRLLSIATPTPTPGTKKNPQTETHVQEGEAVARDLGLQSYYGSDYENTAESVLVKNLEDYAYSCLVSVGTGQLLYLALEPDCVNGRYDTRGSCNGTKLILPDSAIKYTGRTFQSTYGKGSVVGQINISPLAIGKLQITLPIGITTIETDFRNTADGILGLGFNSISLISKILRRNANFIDQLQLDPVFAFYFSNYEYRDYGQVTFGGYDEQRFTGDIKYIPLKSQTFWQFDVSWGTISIPGTAIALGIDNLNDAVADTGTSYIIVGDRAASTINNALGGEYCPKLNVYLLDCGLRRKGVSVTISFIGYDFVIPPSIYIFQDRQSNACWSGITGGAEKSGTILLGDVFLRAYYSIYDKKNNRVGFAKAKQL